jgi:Fur family peroxide stress response transcriptional regulator
MQRRNTIQKQLVIAAVRKLGNHPTAEEVYNEIILQYPRY